jgi:hypothetical protein
MCIHIYTGGMCVRVRARARVRAHVSEDTDTSMLRVQGFGYKDSKN